MVFGPLLKKEHIIDLYRKSYTDESYLRGKSANIAFRRVADCLASDSKEGLNLSVSPVMYQWIEERSPNHHKHVQTPLWPVGLIEVKSSADNIDRIRGCFSLGTNDYAFKPVMAGNSSGGVEPKSVDRYVFSQVVPEEINCYRELEENFIEEFRDEEMVPGENGLYVDFVRMVGFDPISQGKLYLDVGNKPVVKKHPRSWSGLKVNLGQLPPLEALAIDL